ncbi:uncharacterized protein A4U43_C07F27610 [Asparagus officinalis]|uniref:Uncharacterized protein n=1 Tax=Asparagus officinalis TaxID=4686 RepID=A0A5P1EFP9_ASPOF|nr:uncharacterized protein A4U43_C07F27610 [Asparagus officinalis]
MELDSSRRTGVTIGAAWVQEAAGSGEATAIGEGVSGWWRLGLVQRVEAWLTGNGGARHQILVFVQASRHRLRPHVVDSPSDPSILRQILQFKRLAVVVFV